ncbi:GNAT family N-acetyltransferase [Actinomycetes bacterium M1A6_2h]
MSTVSRTVDLVARHAHADDELRWRALWSGYNDFYREQVSEGATAATWQKILEPGSPVTGRVALLEDNIVGFSVSVVHHSSWSVAQVCYLEDLFVDPAARRIGVGRKLVNDLIDAARAQNCSGVYWHTKENNPARQLYDEFVKADEFVRYRLDL